MSEQMVSVSYYIDDKVEWHHKHAPGAHPAIGEGVVGADGKRYRVKDLWHVMEKDGQMDMDVLHVSLEVVTSRADDWPAKVNPDYYEPPSARVWGF